MAENKNEDINIGLRIPRKMHDAIKREITEDMHMNFSEFVRDAIRQKLKEVEG